MPSSVSEDEQKAILAAGDSATAAHLHNLAEKAKERGIPEAVAAHYEKKAWEASKSEEKHQDCTQCHMPPPPPGVSEEKPEPSPICRNCGESNKTPIGLVADIKRNEDKYERVGPLRRLKRPPPSPQSSPQKIYKKQMPRKVAPQISRQNSRPSRAPLAPPPNAKSAKKPKIAEQPEPEFLQKLFGIGAKKVE